MITFLAISATDKEFGVMLIAFALVVSCFFITPDIDE